MAPGGARQILSDRPYRVARDTVAPAGETSHQIWVRRSFGHNDQASRVYRRTHCVDGQTLELPVDPPVIVDRVLILTTKSSSWVAWREVRVFGVPAPQLQAERSSEIIAQVLGNWPEITLRGSLEMPVQITHAGDGSGRLFVVEQKGRIKVISNGHLLPSPFLDISENVACCHEQGLFNVTFPPGYDEKQYFYINYTNAEGDTEIVRYRPSSDANVADPESAELILRIDQPYGIHNGGHMAFGPDGYLYIGTGDGGRAAGDDDRSQDPGTLLGKMLRIDVESGVIPLRYSRRQPVRPDCRLST